jgi:hypothetical protein
MRIRRTHERRTIRAGVRRVLGLTAVIAVATSLLFAAPASAASPGAFNSARCMTGTQSIEQQIEVKRSYLGEHIYLLGALRNQRTGTVTFSNWALGSSQFDIAHAEVRFPMVAKSPYDVYYMWASYNYATSRWDFSSWIQLSGSQLNTYGPVETMPGSDLHISPGETVGYCSI